MTQRQRDNEPSALDPEAPGLDDETRQRRRALAAMQRMSTHELVALAVRAGILTPEGQPTPPYQDDSPSPYRELTGSELDFALLGVLKASQEQAPLTLGNIVDALGPMWLEREVQVLTQLRRMVRGGLVREPERLRFSLEEGSRAAE